MSVEHQANGIFMLESITQANISAVIKSNAYLEQFHTSFPIYSCCDLRRRYLARSARHPQSEAPEVDVGKH